MDLKACIFDLDGVIVDTAKYHFFAWKKLADQIGAHFDHELNEQLKGVSRMKSLEMILHAADASLSEGEKMELAEKKNMWFVEMVNRMTSEEILPGIEVFLDKLEEEGIQKAVGSASKNAKLALGKTGLIDRFDYIVDGTMVEEAKPNPEVFLRAAKYIQVDPGSCVVFEDAIAGVRAAHNGGMKCIGVGDQKTLLEADLVIQSFEKLDLDHVRELL